MPSVGLQHVGTSNLGTIALTAADLADFSGVISKIGSNIATLVIESNIAAGGNLTIPANVTLRFAGGILQVANGQTVTIHGNVIEGTKQIFDCTGTGKVVFGRAAGIEPIPQWWGAVGDGVANDYVAIQKWYDSNSLGAKLRLPAGTYKEGSGIGWSFDSVDKIIEGEGNASVLIAGVACEALIRFNNAHQQLSNFVVDANKLANWGMLLLLGANSTFTGITFKNAIYDNVYAPGGNMYTSADNGTYGQFTWAWTARDLAANPSKNRNNDLIRWVDCTLGFGGHTYKTSGMECRSASINQHTVTGTLKYLTASSKLVAESGASFFTSPTRVRNQDFVRIRATLDSRGGAGLLEPAGTATVENGNTKIRIVGGNMSQWRLRAGDKLTILSTPSGNFVASIKEVVDDEWIRINETPAAGNAGTGFEFTVNTEYIFAVDFPTDSTNCNVLPFFTLPFDVPANEYVIGVGNGYIEDAFGDNNLMTWVGGTYRGNAGAGRHFAGLYAHSIESGISDQNDGFGLILGRIQSGQAHFNPKVTKHYSEANSMGTILIGACVGFDIGLVHNGDVSMSPSQAPRDDIEFASVANCAGQYITGNADGRGFVRVNIGGVTIARRTIDVTSTGIPYITDRGGTTRRLGRTRGTELNYAFLAAAGSDTQQLSVPVLLSETTAAERDLMRPSVDIHSEAHTPPGDTAGPITCSPPYEFAYDSGTQSFKFKVTFTNTHTNSQKIIFTPYVE